MSVRDAYRTRSRHSDRKHHAPVPELSAWCSALLEAAGLNPSDAALVTRSLVDAEACGITSHGVSRTRIYCDRLRQGLVDPAARPSVVRETAATAYVDANNAIGQVGADVGVQEAVRHARQSGAGVAVVRNSNHCGTLRFFARAVASEGLIALVASNGPPVMVYHGGRTRAVGTNPLAIAVPRADGPPLVLDMATSASARGRIILAAQAGGELPEGWAVDPQGRPTTDPEEALAGAVVPFGGPKGSGLAMMIDLLCGGLAAGITGAAVGDMYEDWSRPQQVSHFMMALDPDAWVGQNRFHDHVAAFAKEVTSLPPADGFDSVQLPGEREERAWEQAVEKGVLVAADVVHHLAELSVELEVDVPPWATRTAEPAEDETVS